MITDRQCHYCGGQATTRDHIVPRSRMSFKFRNDPGLAGRVKISNIVASCIPCNQTKSDHRSTCDCGLCALAWQTFAPVGWVEWPRVDPTLWQDYGLRKARLMLPPHAYGDA